MWIPNPLIRRLLLAFSVTIAALNFFDVAASVYPNRFDWIVPNEVLLPDFFGFQLLLFIVTAIVVALQSPRMAAYLTALPIPKPVLLVSSLVLGISFAHILCRSENYPFSNVAMFSIGVPARDASDDLMSVRAYLIRDENGEVRPINFFREASLVFSRYIPGIDYKTAWVLRMYGASHSKALMWFDQQLKDQGLASPFIATVTYSRRDGVLRQWGGEVIGLDSQGQLLRRYLAFREFTQP